MAGTDIELSPAQRAREQINKGKVSLKDIDSTLAPEPTPVEAKAPPLPTITDEQRTALALVPKVFGTVVVTEPRPLQSEELADLYAERDALDVVEKMLAERKKHIREYLLIHNDLDATEQGDEGIGRDKDGHIARKVRFPIPDTDQDWSLEPRAGSSDIDTEVLKAMADDPEDESITHKDYLAMTEQVRVFNEHRAMIVLKSKPELIEAVAKAVKPRGNPSITVTTRKHK